MIRPKPIPLVLIAGFLMLTLWVAENTDWAEVTVPMPPKGEAASNPFYASQRFVEALGAHTSWDRMFSVPSTDAVIVLSSWHWSLSGPRRESLEHWVESGGRLVVDDTLTESENEFEKWSGITWQYSDATDETAAARREPREPCRTLREESDGSVPVSSAGYSLCHFDPFSWLATRKPVIWGLRDAGHLQAIRVSVGRGSVTYINANPFHDRQLFEGDHGRLLVAASELRQGDEVHFLSEDEHPSLLALMWQRGAVALELGLALIALVLWRSSARFGPPAPSQPSARRSLAEQIRGTGEFALRYHSDHALHAACVRALDEAAGRRIAGYARLPAGERMTALARVSGFGRHSLAKAVHHPGSRSAQELRRTIALLESARRRILIKQARSSHGKR